MESANKANRQKKPKRPEVYRYHDYRAFLKDWIEYQKSVRPFYSIRTLASEAGLGSGHLPPILSGAREMTLRTLERILPVLGLNTAEQAFLENLLKMRTADSQATRIAAISKMRRSAAYRRGNPNEAELFEYMGRWVNIAIREMAIVPGFKADAAWIQSKLSKHVTIVEIEQSLKFLVKHGYLVVNKDGTVLPPKGHLDCEGGVFKVALTNYHRQMFGLAAEAIDNTPASERDLEGHTLVIKSDKFDEARAIMQAALEKVRSLGVAPSEGDKQGNSVYHVEFALFPLTKRGTL
jgi:uncharacterized protein (TIGR02147 family)